MKHSSADSACAIVWGYLTIVIVAAPLPLRVSGQGPTEAQKQLFANAANESGLTAMGLNMVDQMTGGQGMQNEDQVKLLYQLMAAHPIRLHYFSTTILTSYQS